MTPEAQRIAIAKACGYKWYSSSGGLVALSRWLSGDWKEIPPDMRFATTSWLNSKAIPDYLYDLNAMHEAEKVLLSQSTINKRNTPFHAYHENLHRLCVLPPKTFNKPMQAEHWAICATAAQRAEAFLRTLNLWTE